MLYSTHGIKKPENVLWEIPYNFVDFSTRVQPIMNMIRLIYKVRMHQISTLCNTSQQKYGFFSRGAAPLPSLPYILVSHYFRVVISWLNISLKAFNNYVIRRIGRTDEGRKEHKIMHSWKIEAKNVLLPAQRLHKSDRKMFHYAAPITHVTTPTCMQRKKKK